MDARSPKGVGDTDLVGRHVLALLPPSHKEQTRHLRRVLEAAKQQWDWQVSVVCDTIDRGPFASLVAPKGHLFAKPALLQVADWENDPVAVANVEQRIGEAERAGGVPFGRLILASAHSLGRAFNVPTRHVRSYPLVRRALKDNMEPYRIGRRLFAFADDMLAEAKPDLIYALHWATPLNFAVWLAATRRGLPCVVLRYSKINADHAFLSTDRLLLNRAAIQRGSSKRQAGSPPSEAAKAYIRAFRKRPMMIKFIAAKWRNRMQRGYLRWHIETARTIRRQLLNQARGQDQALIEPIHRRILRYYHSLFLTFWQQRYLIFLDEGALASMKYAYFPLHKEAEIAKTYQTTLWYDQPNTIRVLASMLPFGYRLLVREHRMNYGNRPTRSYRQLSRIPNVVLIDPFDSQFKYLRHADLVITENGSSGWEGLLMGRPVLLLSHAFYDGAGQAVRMEDPDRLNEKIFAALDRPAPADPAAYDDALGCMVDGELETTFPMTAEGMPAALDQLANLVAGKSASRGCESRA